MKPAASKQNSRREYQKSGDCQRQRKLKEHGVDAIDSKTPEGNEAEKWRRKALKAWRLSRGCRAPYDIREQIDEATFDLYRRLCLRAYIIADDKTRGTLINRRRRELPRIHEQYATISASFDRRCERLQLDKGDLDLARRLMLKNGGQSR